MRYVRLALLVIAALLLTTVGLSGWSASAEPNPVVFEASLDGAQAGVESEATGAADVSLDTDSNVLSWNLTWAGFSSDVVAIHFHGPAEVGEDAFVSVELGFISGIVAPSIGEATINEEQKAELLSERWYINIHTQDFVVGEIRGQVVRAELLPTPEPTATPAQLLLGDVNCSGVVDSIDATLVLQLGAGLITSLPCEESADVNADQEITSVDALNILFLVAGFIEGF